MSRSPTKQGSAEEASEYTHAYRAVYELVAQGRPWSGNERHCVFLNTGGSRFANISATSGLDFKDDGRGIVYVDWDHDGDLDLWTANRTAPQIRFLRNDTPHKGRFLAVRLEGQTSNRDAIGARVEVVLNQKSKIKNQKSIHAGQGYLSQSSKWLHFGLGQDTEVDRLVVNWPGGPTEAFTGLRANHHYKIVQGSDQAERWTPPDRSVHLSPSTLNGDPPTTAGRISLNAPPRIPNITYNDFAGNTISLNSRIREPTLVNLWASWCTPCHTELQAMRDHKAQLRDAGLKIVILSVDGLDSEQTSEEADARNLVDKLNLPFEAGFANAESLTKLQLIHDLLFHRRIQLAIPTSFLIDREGKLVSIYRGPVNIATLLEDLRHLDITPDERSGPFPGRWAARPMLHDEAIAKRFDQEGFLDDAITYFHDAVRRRPNDAHLYVALGTRLLRQGKQDEVLKLYREAVRINPESADVHYNLGILLASRGETDQSIHQLRQALAINPNYASAHLHLGMALASQGRFDDGVKHYEESLRIMPDYDRAHFQLSIALLSQRQFDAGMGHLREALRVNPDMTEALNMMASILATHGDPRVRQPKEAVRLAKRASELTQNKDPIILSTLAEAYASNGQFNRALTIAETALELATETQAGRLAVQIRRRLEIYRRAVRDRGGVAKPGAP